MFRTQDKPKSVKIRDSIVVSISACHAEDPGSIPGRGIYVVPSMIVSANNSQGVGTGTWTLAIHYVQCFIGACVENVYQYGHIYTIPFLCL